MDDNDISQESEAYRKWKEGSSRSTNGESNKPLYESTGVELSTPAFLQNWRRKAIFGVIMTCLLYTSPSPRDVEEYRMPSSA